MENDQRHNINYICEICYKKFTKRKNLNKHVRRIHVYPPIRKLRVYKNVWKYASEYNFLNEI